MEILSRIILALKHCRVTEDSCSCNDCPMKDDEYRPCTHKGEGEILKALEDYCDSQWFGKVRWCDDDIREALRNNGFKDCEVNISVIRKECEHHCFKDGMIETGWHYINSYIQENENLLV